MFVVDAFVGELDGRILQGNPAAVALLDAPQNAEWMQTLATKMGLSETAFVSPNGDGFDLRWFTPQVEVQLCGHATLASAHVLWESGRLQTNKIASFATHSGILRAKQQSQGIELDFPAQEVQMAPVSTDLMHALGIQTRDTPHFWKAGDDWLIELASGHQIETLRPDFADLGAVCRQINARGIIVTAPSQNSAYHFVSRFFAPSIGVDEDPVTGSAHTKLAPFWGSKLGKTTMIGYQASPRGGLVCCEWRGARVGLLGKCATVSRDNW